MRTVQARTCPLPRLPRPLLPLAYVFLEANAPIVSTTPLRAVEGDGHRAGLRRIDHGNCLGVAVDGSLVHGEYDVPLPQPRLEGDVTLIDRIEPHALCGVTHGDAHVAVARVERHVLEARRAVQARRRVLLLDGEHARRRVLEPLDLLRERLQPRGIGAAVPSAPRGLRVPRPRRLGVIALRLAATFESAATAPVQRAAAFGGNSTISNPP